MTDFREVGLKCRRQLLSPFSLPVVCNEDRKAGTLAAVMHHEEEVQGWKW